MPETMTTEPEVTSPPSSGELLARLTTLLATPALFRRWLAEQPSEATVGVGHTQEACAIACFLGEQFPGLDVRVGGHYASLWSREPDEGGTCPRLAMYFIPGLDHERSWQAGFVMRFDKLACDRPLMLVSAGDALVCLDEAIADVAAAA